MGEAVHPIRHCLIAREPLALEDDRDGRLPPAGQRPVRALHPRRGCRARGSLAVGSTADAVRMVAEQRRAAGPRWGPALSAELYGCEILRAGVEDVADNETRFVWLARAGAEAARQARGRPRSSSGASAPRRPGWLVRCLSEFAFRGVNLTKIESRPRKQGLGRYMFFVDLEGREPTSPVAVALEALRTQHRDGAGAGLLPGGLRPTAPGRVAGGRPLKSAPAPMATTVPPAPPGPRRLRAPAARA